MIERVSSRLMIMIIALCRCVCGLVFKRDIEETIKCEYIFAKEKSTDCCVEKHREREKPIRMHTKDERTMRMDCHRNTASLLA